MVPLSILLECIGKALARPELAKWLGTDALTSGEGGPLGNGFVDLLPELAQHAWSEYAELVPAESERRAELEGLLQAPAAAIREEAAEIADAVVAQSAEALRDEALPDLAGYLAHVPGAARRALRRPSDPSGTTVPPTLAFAKADDLLPFLPDRVSQRKVGDYPLAGVDWQLEELLGIGRFGEVWKAQNPDFEGMPPVILKFCLDPFAKSRLLRHKAAILNQVMRQGRLRGIALLRRTYLRTDPPCLEYEHVEGIDLGMWIQQWYRERDRLRPRDAARIVQRLAELLGQAHRLKPPLVHRDLKPANILIRNRSGGKLDLGITDLGIGDLAAGRALARSTHGLSYGVLRTTLARGGYTPLYSSPQQVRGKRPDPRDDVYAIGVIWYQLLTGDLTRGRPGGRHWLRRLVERGMEEGLVDLLAECFEDAARDRPADAAVLAERLDGLLKGETGALFPALPSGEISIAHDDAEPGLGPLSHGSGHAEPGTNGALNGARAAPRPAPSPPAAAAPSPPPDGSGEYDRFLMDCTEAIRLNPEDAEAYHNRAIAHFTNGADERAIADCSEAIRLNPEFDLAYFSRANAYVQRGEFERALADYAEAIRLNPDAADYYEGRADALRAAGDAVQAASDERKANKLRIG